MEASQTEQQQQTAAGAPGTARWLGFAAWLRQQAGGEEAVSEASASDAEDGELVHTAEHQQQSSHQVPAASSSGTAGRAGGSLATPSAPPTRGQQLARHATLAPRLPDCRSVTRLTNDSSSRARQEMTVMLTAPGMPLHQAPLLTAKQASALMAAICEPLLSLPVGRLTRRLSAPTKLQPTEDRGVISLWLLPDDSLSLVWQSAQQLGPEAIEEAVGAAAAAAAATVTPSSSAASLSGYPSSSSDGNSSPHSASSEVGTSASSSGSSGAALPALQQSCSVAVWEELAHFPAQAHLLDDAPVVTIHMLRGDTSGRSFYIRVRGDVAEANLEAATTAVPDASRMLQQQRAAAAAGAGAAAAGMAPDAAEPPGAPRMYFWLADRDLGKAVYSLGRLKSLLKRPPTLSKRSGVPERQLAQLGAWVHQADLAAAEQQRAAAAAAAQRQLEQAAWDEDAAQQREQQLQHDAGKVGAAAAGSLQLEAGTSPLSVPALGTMGGGGSSSSSVGGRPCSAPHLSPLLGGACGSGLLLGQPGSMAAAAHVQGSMAALLPPSSPLQQQQQQQPAPGGTGVAPGSGQASEPGSPALVCSTSTVSATAAALYQDHRFNVVCPCTISVVVGMKVQAAGTDPSLLPPEASSRARAVAEQQAKTAVDRSGRQRIEERLAEVVIRNIRAQRNRARQARQAQRDTAVRLQQAERALLLARQATGRAPPHAPAPGPLPAAPAVAAAEAAAAAAPGADRVPPTPLPAPSPAALDPQLHAAPAVPSLAEGAHGSSSILLGRGGGSSSSGEGEVVQLATPMQGQGGRALSSPVVHPASPASRGAQEGGRAFSAPAALPLPPPLLPGGRVTIGNLQSLLAQPQGLNSSSQQGSSPSELAPAAATTSSGAGSEAAAGGPPSRVSVADLADLLGKHAKLE